MVAVRSHGDVRTRRAGARARRVAAGALVALVMLAGCGPAEGEGEPTVGLPTKTMAPQTEEAEPTAAETVNGLPVSDELPEPGETVVFPEDVELPAPSPTEPPAEEDFPLRREQSEEGAIDAAMYYWQLNTYGRATGDTSEYESLTSPECGFCANQVDLNKAISETGKYNSAQYVSAQNVTISHEDSATIVVNFDANYPLYYSVDEQSKSVAGISETVRVGLRMTWQDSGWLVESGAILDGDGTSE